MECNTCKKERKGAKAQERGNAIRVKRTLRRKGAGKKECNTCKKERKGHKKGIQYENKTAETKGGKTREYRTNKLQIP